MTQRYGHVMGAFWRRASEAAENRDQAGQLRISAAGSEALADLAAHYWPVRDQFGVLEQIADADQHKLFEPDNPAAMFDVRSASERVQASCEAAALALGGDYEKFSSLLLEPIMLLNLELAEVLNLVWTHQLSFWANLLRENPIAYVTAADSSHPQ
jgi:hypothetical protein